MFLPRLLINDDASDGFPSFISTTCRLKSSSRMWWASWRPIRSNLRSATLPLTRLTGSGWGRTFRRSPGQPRGILSHRRFSMKANIVGWETRARFDLWWCCWFSYCDRHVHAESAWGWAGRVPGLGPSHRQKEGKSAGSRVWALLSRPCAPNPQRAAVSDTSPSVGACARAHIILHVQKRSFILSGFFFFGNNMLKAASLVAPQVWSAFCWDRPLCHACQVFGLNRHYCSVSHSFICDHMWQQECGTVTLSRHKV